MIIWKIAGIDSNMVSSALTDAVLGRSAKEIRKLMTVLTKPEQRKPKRK